MSARVKLVKVRLSGDAAALGAALALLVSAIQGSDAQIAEQSSPYQNRNGDGYRVYLTLVLPAAENTGPDGAAHSRQAIRRPATPITARDSRRRHHP